MSIRAVILDLDGVILSTDNYHYLAWQAMADREGIPFDREFNERLRGVSRRRSLELILEQTDRTYSEQEKQALSDFKNDTYRASLQHLSAADIFPGVLDFLEYLDKQNIRAAIGSSSKNTKLILEKIGLLEHFQGAISDGTNITHSKPDPEVFLKAAAMVSVPPQQCLVIEDADAGIEAAKRGGMIAFGVGPAANHPQADFSAPGVAEIDRSIFQHDQRL